MKTLNLSWLEDFLVLSASGNFSRAAEERYMTQPAFNRRIRALEEWLGVELFDRSQQPARLTDSGQWFTQMAKTLLQQAAQLPSEAQVFAESQSGRLRIASTHALSFMFMPQWLRNLESERSPGQIQLISDVLPRCESLLVARQVQFLLTHTLPNKPNPLDEAQYTSLVVGHDTLLPVSSAIDAQICRHPISPMGRQKPLQLLTYSPESGIGGMIADLQKTVANITETQIVFTAHLASVLRTMALDGRGMAWLPKTLIDDDLKQGRLCLAGDAQWHLPLQVRLYRDKGGLSAAAEHFWAANERQAQALNVQRPVD